MIKLDVKDAYYSFLMQNEHQNTLFTMLFCTDSELYEMVNSED